MQPEWSPRISWPDLPNHVQTGVEQILGEPVVQTAAQQGGFSPGTADRVRTVSGRRRAFVKAVGPHLNEHSPALHRREAAITAALPDTLPAPALLGTFDDVTGWRWSSAMWTAGIRTSPGTPGNWRPSWTRSWCFHGRLSLRP